MKPLDLTLLFYLAFFFSGLAHAESGFEKAKVEVMQSACHPLDFTSYSRARNAEVLIRKNNTNFEHPNFGGQFLLLQVPFMMGTDWLIADCTTGKFFHEVLTGNAQFQPNSKRVQILDPKNPPAEWFLWTGTSFIKDEEKNPQTETPTPPQPQDWIARYEGLFKQYPVEKALSSCHALDYNSYFRAQNAKGEILKSGAELRRPNFAGNLILIRVELLFETLWLIADCNSGKFFHETLSDHLAFTPTSRLVVQSASSGKPQLFVFEKESWIKKPDSTLANRSPVENEIRLEKSRQLTSILPNPDHHHRIVFNHFRCGKAENVALKTCEGFLGESRDPKNQFILTPEQSIKTIEIIQTYGNAGEILSGSCLQDGSSCSLVAE